MGNSEIFTKRIFFLIPLILLVCGCSQQQSHRMREGTSLIRYVNPLIGTAQATTARMLESKTESFAQTIPSVTWPHGMTNWTAQTQTTEKKCLAPYYYADSLLTGFRGTHWLNGSCVQDYGSFTIMPMLGNTGFLPSERAISFSHDQEISSPHCYELDLSEAGIQVSMTATKRCGFLRVTFNKAGTRTFVIEVNSDESQGFVQIDTVHNRILGYNPVHRIYQGWGEEAGFSGYFVAEFDQQIVEFGIYDEQDEYPDESEGENKSGLGAFVSFEEAVETIHVRIGTSFTSLEQAEKNLEAEISDWNFEGTKENLVEAWEELLGRVKVSGTEPDKTIFYTGLYRSFLHPRLMSDVDGKYPGFAGSGKTEVADGFEYYGDFSTWDTYRAVHPLHNLLAPEYSADFVQSLIAKAEQGGWMPIFPCWNSYTAAMIGDHLASVIADAYLKGVDIPNIETAYHYLRKNAFETPADHSIYADGKGRRALTSYLEYGYIPMEDAVQEAFHKEEQVSRTLEYAYDDFALAKLAESLGETEDAVLLFGRAKNYQHVFDPSVGYMRGRHADGSWAEGFEPNGVMDYITEGTPKHYSWYVPHDVEGLIELMGGDSMFVAKLDSFFDLGEYWHGNEPCHQTYFLYNYAGQPQKSQALVRRIIREDYHAGPSGLSGNEDGGQMSAWLVFASMGFYPVCPGTDEYALVSPMFEEVRIEVPGRAPFIISAPGADDQKVFIQHVLWKGKPYSRSFLTHEMIKAGGMLEIELGVLPDK